MSLTAFLKSTLSCQRFSSQYWSRKLPHLFDLQLRWKRKWRPNVVIVCLSFCDPCDTSNSPNIFVWQHAMHCYTCGFVTFREFNVFLLEGWNVWCLLITLNFMSLAQNMFERLLLYRFFHILMSSFPDLSCEFLSFMQLSHPPSRWWKFENWGALAACELSPRLALSTSCFTCCCRSTQRHTQDANTYTNTYDLQTHTTLSYTVRHHENTNTQYANTNTHWYSNSNTQDI